MNGRPAFQSGCGGGYRDGGVKSGCHLGLGIPYYYEGLEGGFFERGGHGVRVVLGDDNGLDSWENN